jgi:Putative Actinobacterial Holin-X, holin superfamily III
MTGPRSPQHQAAPSGPVASPGVAYARPPHAAAGYDDIGEVSVGELVGNVTRDLSTLMRQELALAQAEVKAEVSKTGKAAGALGAAGYMAVLFLSICLWWALGHLIGNGWPALVVAVLWGIVGAVLYSSGRKKLKEVHPTPERTVDTLKNVPDALKGEVGGHRLPPRAIQTDPTRDRADAGEPRPGRRRPDREGHPQQDRRAPGGPRPRHGGPTQGEGDGQQPAALGRTHVSGGHTGGGGVSATASQAADRVSGTASAAASSVQDAASAAAAR